MKAIDINGTIKVFGEVPKTWKNYLNFRKADVSVWESEGFFDVEIPDYDPDTERLGDLSFDGERKVFVYAIVLVSLPMLEDAKKRKIADLKEAVSSLYYAIQWYINMKQMENETIPVAVRDKIRLIKTKYEQVRDEINALTNVIDVIKYQLPTEQINNLREQLESIQ